MLLLARARHGPDAHQGSYDLKRLNRAEGFEIPQRLGQILLELPELLGLTAAELVQVGYGQRVGGGVARVEAVQPQRQGLTAEQLCVGPSQPRIKIALAVHPTCCYRVLTGEGGVNTDLPFAVSLCPYLFRKGSHTLHESVTH